MALLPRIRRTNSVTDGTGNPTAHFQKIWQWVVEYIEALATVATTGSFNDLTDKPGFRTVGQVVISATGTLAVADAGSNILFTTSGITFTFPATGYASGQGVLLSNVSGGAVTFAFPGGSDMGTTFNNGDSIIVICDGGGFWRQYCYSTTRL